MCSSEAGVLSIDKRIILFAIRVAVGDHYLDIVAHEMYHGVEWGRVHAFVKQVGKTILRDETLSVEVESKTGVEVAVVAQQSLDILHAELISLEYGVVGLELHIGAIHLFACLHRTFLHFLGSLVGYLLHLAVAHRAHEEMSR